MSSREPLWFCHACRAEMRPLMVPDPVCASCHGSFVEKMENTADDPRQFAADVGGPADAGIPSGMDTLFLTLQSLMDRGMGARNATPQRTGSAVTVEVRGPGGARTLRFGGPNTLNGGGGGVGRTGGSRPSSPDAVPNMTSFIRPVPLAPFGIPLDSPSGGPGGDRQNISGALMAQYLMALLGYHDPTMLGMPENGRLGDYVFNQEALDQIISQIMENSNTHRPVPAPEETIAKLPREVLMEGSATLERDCAVCKEQFKLQTEDPDEQIVVTLPCKHPFHQPCIVPWLTSSGTCPVCRFSLVPQPEHHSSPHSPQSGNNNSRSRSPPPHGNDAPRASQSSSHPPPHSPGNGGNTRGSEAGGIFHSIFSGLSGFAHPHSSNNHPSSPRGTGSVSPRPISPHLQQRSAPHRRSDSDPSSRSSSPRSNQNHNSPGGHLPGEWSDELD